MTLALSSPVALAATPNPLLQPARPQSLSALEGEMARLPHLAGDRRHVRRNRKLELREATQAKTAAESLGSIPGPEEAFHMLISGRFALWDFVPAVLTLASCAVERLTVATLGFSRRNVTQMAALVDAGQIGSVRLLFSHYFRGTSGTIVEHMEQEFQARADRMEHLSIRTHAKIMLLALADGRRLTIESSANLRSCKNIEQASAFGSPELHDFHAGWIDELFQAARANDGAQTKA